MRRPVTIAIIMQRGRGPAPTDPFQSEAPVPKEQAPAVVRVRPGLGGA